MNVLLNSNWTLVGARPCVDLAIESGRDIKSLCCTDKISATVPGGVHFDLFRAGIIDNPYFSTNSFACEWTENRWWVYETDISPVCGKYKKVYLVFKGVDTKAVFFINGVRAAVSDNMFVPVKIDITSYLSDKINVKVVLCGAQPELGQFGKTSETTTQKSRFGYGWDFSARLVNIGIWDGVYLEYTDGAELESVKITTDYDGTHGYITAAYDFTGADGKDVKIDLFAPDGRKIDEKAGKCECSTEKRFVIKNPQLWYPIGMGEQPLYTVKMTCGAISQTNKTGVRRIEYLDCGGQKPVRYTIAINGKPVFLKGVNKVPLDHLYGNVTRGDYEFYIDRIAALGCNFVRVWGGGIIEKEDFYDLCDSRGILIWQEFIQSSSSEENIPSTKPEFLEKLRMTALCATAEKRNHVSLVMWCGGNELTNEDGSPVTYENKNIAMLKSIVDKNNPEIQMLPSAPYGDVYMFDFQTCGTEDVHGYWDYAGNPQHYEGYNRIKLRMHSEYGTWAPPLNISKFLKPSEYEIASTKKWGAYMQHAGHWMNILERDEKIYGSFDNYTSYIKYAQLTQAESLRYALETDRRNAPYTAGSVIWQINEPWPNASCSSLVDYFGEPKMAYYILKKSFSDFAVSARYDSLNFKNRFIAQIAAFGDCAAPKPCIAALHSLDGTLIKQAEITAYPYDFSADISQVSDIFMLRLTGGENVKDYIFSKTENTHYKGLRSINTVLKYALVYDGDFSARLKIKNDGAETAFAVSVHDGYYTVLADDLYFNLLPGEEKEISLKIENPRGLFFEKRSPALQLKIDALGNVKTVKGI